MPFVPTEADEAWRLEMIARDEFEAWLDEMSARDFEAEVALMEMDRYAE